MQQIFTALLHKETKMRVGGEGQQNFSQINGQVSFTKNNLTIFS